jgi:hypothetical protein
LAKLSGMLLFKKKFLEAIRAGQKTQTIRLWRYSRMRAGQRSYIPGAGYIRLTAVEEVRLEALTDADAGPDGFETADQLRQEIARLYPQQLADGYRAFRIVFHLLPPEEQKKRESKAESAKSKAKGRESRVEKPEAK